MTQAELLSSARLKMNASVRKSTAQPQRVLLRSSGGLQRLVLSQAQAAILSSCFAQAGTVPEALVHLLNRHECPPLSEYYELVLQACAHGVLVTDDEPKPVIARRWPVRISVRTANLFGGILLVASLVALALPPWGAPANWSNWLVGWLVICALVSAGEVLGACVLTEAGCEVRALQFHRKTLLPHLRIDAMEAEMGGPACELAVASLRTVPVALGAALVAWFQPGWLASLSLGLFYVLAPWNGRPAAQWLRARYGAPPFTVRTGSLFDHRSKDAWGQWRIWWADLQPWTILHWALWILLLGLTIGRSLPGPIATLLHWFGLDNHSRLLLRTGIISLATVTVIAVGTLAQAAIRHWWLQRQLTQPLGEAAGQKAAAAALQGDTPAVLRQIPLFQSLSEGDLAALAPAMKPVQVGKNTVVFHEDAPGDAFFVVLEGELEILKRQPKPADNLATIGWLRPGSGFGEVALLENTVRSATVRATRPCRLLRLDKGDFERFIVSRVGAARVREVLLYATFLGRLVFFAGWSFDDLVRYAQACGGIRAGPGSIVLMKGQPNNSFYLIYDGAFEARDGTRVLRRMGPGDYFGELSLLGNAEATADVVAIEESRCLTMSRPDFLSFFSKDFRMGLRMEALATQRRGKTIFESR